MDYIKRYFQVLTFTAAFSLVFSGAFCSDIPEAKIAPLNPNFMSYKTETHQRSSKSGVSGHIPSPVAPEVHRAEKKRDRSDLPAEYDLRDPNGDGSDSDSLLTPVKNQGGCGVCWTFATYGALESHLKKKFALSDADNDYSEDHMKHTHGFDEEPGYGACSGGNIEMSAAYLARHSGPVKESDDPYDDTADSAYCENCQPSGYVDNIVFMPVRSSVSDNDYIKEALQTYGALHTAILWADQFYDATQKTYYCSENYETNHCVVIAGWDDDKVVSGAPGNGAFLIRNSWGSDWGDGGYFYISYYDMSLAFDELAYFADEDDAQLSFDTIYQYDTLGWTGNIGYDSETAWAANVFTPSDDGQVQAIGFYATASDTSYEIQIYDTMSSDTAQYKTLSVPLMTSSKTGSVQYPGYYTITLDTPVSVSQGDDFIVAVKFTTPGNSYPIALEARLTDYSSSATANAGESYSGPENNDAILLEESSYNNEAANVCIKAFVKQNSKTLSDVIAYLQILVGITPSGSYTDSDINKDGRIGLEEAIYGLREIAKQ